MGNPPLPGHSPIGPAITVNGRRELLLQHAAWLRRQPDAWVIIVCGGRNYQDRERVFAALDRAHAKRRITLLVHGGAPGADTLAGEWAKERGVWVQVFEADWDRHGKAAGPMRNQAMLDAGCGGVIAFPGGSGTADMCRRAERAGVKVWRPFG